MRLTDYQWSRNPRGLHVQRALITPLDYSRWSQPNFGWVKLVAAREEYVNDALDFMNMGITPIVRLWRPRFGAAPFNAELRALTDMYLNVGVKWFEFYNEPNLGVEWPEGFEPDWRNTAGVIVPLMENWLVWAEYIISRGGYPGFIPLAESDNLPFAAIHWMDAFLNYMAQNRFERFQNVLANGMYVATHPYILNHFYQEVPGRGPTSVRQPLNQRAQEPGWHFEYPYDPFQQSLDPGRTVYGGTRLTPNGDPVGLIAMGRMFNERARALFGTQAVPVVGTEGGIWPFPRQNGPAEQQDTRYPSYNHESHAEATVAMFEWIARQAPPWFFGVCLWKEDDYYYPEGGHARAIDRLREIPPILKNVPAIDVMGEGFVPGFGPFVGPAPIHGQADFHMMILAPGLDSRFFFETAQGYWNVFRPVVVTDTNLIEFIPNDRSLAVTVISPPELVDTMTSLIQERYPNVFLDLVISEDTSEIAALFNERARRGLRFG